MIYFKITFENFFQRGYEKKILIQVYTFQKTFLFTIFAGSKDDENLDDLKKELELDVHKVSVDELCKRYGSDINSGLTEQRAKANFERDGPNGE